MESLINKLKLNLNVSFLLNNNSRIFFKGTLFGIGITFFIILFKQWNYKLSLIINLSELILPLIFQQKSINEINENNLNDINIKRIKHSKLPIGSNIKMSKQWIINLKSNSKKNSKKNFNENNANNENKDDTDDNISIYFYKPFNCRLNCPIIIWIHGGGFVVGNAKMYEPITTKIANETGCIVAAIDYRKAPEHKFPQPVLDCIQATQWIYDHAHEYDADQSKITVLGDSAGGNLTIIVTCELKHLIKLSIPIYPVISFGILSESKVTHYNAPMLKGQSIDWYNLRYFKNRQDMFDKLATPLYRNDLNLLPTTFVITAEFDPLVEEGKEYVTLLKNNGVQVTHINYPNTVHGFFGTDLLTHGHKALFDTCNIIKNHFEL